VLMIALLPGILPAVHAQKADYGAVHGVVLHYDGTPLAGGEVELSSREEDFTAKVDARGRFSLHARPGVYSIRVDNPSILPFQRAQIVLRAGSVVNLNVRPVFKDPDPGMRYFSFPLPGPFMLAAVIRRVDRIRENPGEDFGQDYVMLSDDTLSVYAHKLDCDRRTLKCLAEGDARVEIGTEDGIRTERAPRIEIGLTDRTLTLTRGESVEEITF